MVRISTDLTEEPIELVMHASDARDLSDLLRTAASAALKLVKR